LPQRRLLVKKNNFLEIGSFSVRVGPRTAIEEEGGASRHDVVEELAR
jgi:hypothetical protein